MLVRDSSSPSTVSPRALSKRGAAVVLTALAALATWLRLRGLDYFLPHSNHLDATVIRNQVATLRSGAQASDSGLLDEWYPYLLARLTEFFTSEPAGGAMDLEGHLRNAAEPFLAIRIVSALASVPIVVATYRLTRSFTTRVWSLFAALLLATSALNISFAQQERPHALAATLVAFTVLSAIRLTRRPTLAWCALVGACAGLAIGSLQSAAAVGFPIVTAAFLAARAPDARRPGWPKLLAGAALCLALIAAIVRWCYPFHFGAERGFLSLARETDGSTFNLSGQTVYLEHFDGSGFVAVLGAVYSYTPHVLALLVVACVASLVRRKRTASSASRRAALWVTLAYVVPYTIVIGLHSLTWERYVMPLEPFLACFCAWGLARVASWRAWPALTVAAAAAVFATAVAWKLGSVRAAPDTFELAATWLRANARPERDPIVSMPYIDLPLLHRDETLATRPAFTQWAGYQAALSPEQKLGPRYDLVLPRSAQETRAEWGDDPLAHLRRIGARYAVVQQVGEGFRYKLAVRTRQTLIEHAVLRIRCSPLARDDGRQAGLGIRRHRERIDRPFALNLFVFDRMGPTIEIYELPSE